MTEKQVKYVKIGTGVAIAALAAGAIYYIYKRRKKAKATAPTTMPENDQKTAQNEVFDFGEEVLNETPKTSEKAEYEQILASEQYLAENEHPEDDLSAEEEEDLRVSRQMQQYRDEHRGQIEMMREDDWDTDFPEEDYYPYELWYFPDENVLTDEDGEILEPISDYVGIIFDKTRFRYNDWDFIYIRNHIKEEKYKIHKEFMARDEFFP